MYTDYPVNHHAAEDARLQSRSDQQERDEPRDGPRIPAVTMPATPTPVVPVPSAATECPQCHATPGEPCRNYQGAKMGTYHSQRKAKAAAHSPQARAAKHAMKEATDNRRATVAAIRRITEAQAEPEPAPIPAPPTPDTDNGLPVGRGGVLRPRGKAAEAQAEADAREHRTPDAQAQADAAAERDRTQRRTTKPKPTPDPELSELDRAVEALVREHTSGAVIDATWNAARRIFRA